MAAHAIGDDGQARGPVIRPAGPVQRLGRHPLRPRITIIVVDPEQRHGRPAGAQGNPVARLPAIQPPGALADEQAVAGGKGRAGAGLGPYQVDAVLESRAGLQADDLQRHAPTGRVREELFLPEITNVGHRHPVTEGLSPLPVEGEETPAPWGRWMRIIDVTTESGNAIMQGPDAAPLPVRPRLGNGLLKKGASQSA